MAARGDRPSSDQSFAENAIILDALERDPDHVFRVLAQIAERLKVDGRYTAEEVEAAAQRFRSWIASQRLLKQS